MTDDKKVSIFIYYPENNSLQLDCSTCNSVYWQGILCNIRFKIVTINIV